MKPEEQDLLIRCLELTNEFATYEKPAEWQTWVYDDWLAEATHGPRYLISAWFGPLRERDRVRYRRAIDNLEADGLMVTHRQWGTRLTHVKLTEAGKALAAQLTAPTEAASDG